MISSYRSIRFKDLSRSTISCHPQSTSGSISHLPFCGTAAWTVQEALGASGNGADSAGVVEFALAAGLTAFYVVAFFFGATDESGIQGGINRSARISFGHESNARATGHGNNRFHFGNDALDLFDVFRITLSFDCLFDYLDRIALALSRAILQLAGQDAHRFIVRRSSKQ